MSIRKGSRTIASSVPVTEWGSVDGTLTDQADLKNALDSKAEKYSPTFTGTPLAPTAPVGTSNNQIATTKYVQEALLNAEANLPEQSGNAGKFLTTNGQIPSWANVDALPSQAGNNGKYLITNGTTASWSTLNGVVHLTGNESIDGVKTFNSTIHLKRTLNSETSEQLNEVQFNDINTSARTGGVRNRLTSGVNITEIYVADGNTYKNGIMVSDNGTSTAAYLANQPDASNSTDSKLIATLGWVNDPTKSTNVVHRSGDETIAGVKTFSSVPLITGGCSSSATGKEGGELHIASIQNSSSNNYGIIDVYGNTPEDSTTHCIRMRMSSGNNGLKVFNDGHAEIATAPAANSNDSSIPTTSWVNTKVSGVTLNGGNDISIDSNKNINYTGPKYYRLGTRTWTYAQWTQYCERGVTTNISPSYTVTGIKAGDLVTVEGICSDRGNANTLAWGIANSEPAAETNNVSVTFLGLNIQDSFFVPNPIQVVTSLPSSPDANTIYIVTG